MSVPEYAHRLRDAVAHAAPILLGLDADASARPLATGKWSPREIVGHLIDSAANNHQRFVRGQLQDDLVFLGYAQEDWVASSTTRTRPGRTSSRCGGSTTCTWRGSWSWRRPTGA